MPLGADYQGNGECSFLLWAPICDSVELQIDAPAGRRLPMEPLRGGYWRIRTAGVSPGSLYRYRLDAGRLRPDPASHFQPEGVHGPSAVIDHRAFPWTDRDFRAPAFERLVFYELHVGTYSPQRTFAGVVSRLDMLVELGINALELMPVAAFPGERNWGYDGVYPFSVQHSYGGPDQLKGLIDACHGRGIAVVLDVVYNHLGPEGNYLRDFGPYFTGTYTTPWGEAVNFDGPYSDEVRRYFLENARHWFSRYHVDALRLDAVHAIYDSSAYPFLRELADATRRWSHELGRPLYLIAESDLNDVRLIDDPAQGGFGLRAQWSDDFHHALHAYLSGEQDGYYRDFGNFEDIVKAVRDGFVYDWRYSEYRKRRHGSSSRDQSPDRLVVCIQNHDQVGNRMLGERLGALVSPDTYKLAAALLLLGPNLPLLFMGQEYGESAPFQYFVSHGDPDLVEAVRRGRREEFHSFGWTGQVPDPQDPAVFQRSTLCSAGRTGRQRILLELHARLIRLRRRIFDAQPPPEIKVSGIGEQPILFIRYTHPSLSFLCLFNFSAARRTLKAQQLLRRTARCRVHKIFDSAAEDRSPPEAGGLEAADAAHRGQTASLNHGSHIELPAYGVLVYACTGKETQ